MTQESLKALIMICYQSFERKACIKFRFKKIAWKVVKRFFWNINDFTLLQSVYNIKKLKIGVAGCEAKFSISIFKTLGYKKSKIWKKRVGRLRSEISNLDYKCINREEKKYIWKIWKIRVARCESACQLSNPAWRSFKYDERKMK